MSARNERAHTWSPLRGGDPGARAEHTAVWTGAEMIVWGGSGNLDTGGRLSPTANSWLPIGTANAPPGRYRHTAVWTGSEMIIWGGFSSSYLQSGARYTP